MQLPVVGLVKQDLTLCLSRRVIQPNAGVSQSGVGEGVK